MRYPEKMKYTYNPTPAPPPLPACGPDAAVQVKCRPNCGACCIAPSISSAIPRMPHGKPSDTRCAQLMPDLSCALFDTPARPAVCSSFQPSADMCGCNAQAAYDYLLALEKATAPETRNPAADPCLIRE